jgi:hypothetical protein
MDKQRAFRFFCEQAGYAVGERAVGALRLAKAEAAAKDVLRFRWVDDIDADYSWLDEKKETQADHEVFGCIAERQCTKCGHWEQAASLWGIFDPSPEYRRVVEAELALELIGRK